MERKRDKGGFNRISARRRLSFKKEKRDNRWQQIHQDDRVIDDLIRVNGMSIVIE